MNRELATTWATATLATIDQGHARGCMDMETMTYEHHI